MLAWWGGLRGDLSFLWSSAPVVQKILMGWRVAYLKQGFRGEGQRKPKVTVVCVCCEWTAVFPAFFSVRADGREIQPPDLLGQENTRVGMFWGRHHMRRDKKVWASVSAAAHKPSSVNGVYHDAPARLVVRIYISVAKHSAQTSLSKWPMFNGYYLGSVIIIINGRIKTS